MSEGLMTENTMTVTAWPNPYARISEVAARVGVAPHKMGDPATVTMLGADGNAYDVWAVVVAVLDKLDAVAVSAGDST
jgi:hypothetical protein